MATDVQTPPGPNMSALVGGIIHDAQQLIRQEVRLARSELHQEWGKIKTAFLAFAAGAVVAFLGTILLLFGLVHLLHWTAGALDHAVVPLWGWFFIVGAVITLIGGVLLYRGVQQASEIQVPPPQTAESLKEIL